MNARTSTLYRGGLVYAGATPATALLVRDDQILWTGNPGDAGAPTEADHTVDLEGALVLPAFVDAHVHATATGLTIVGLDLSACRSTEDLLDRLRSHARSLSTDAVVLGHGWDDSTWAPRTNGGDQRPPTRVELAAATDGRSTYLSRVDAHSALVSGAALDHVDATTPGFAEDGWLTLEAHHVARRYALGSLTAAQRTRAQTATLRLAASRGVAALHECAGPTISSEDDLTALLKLTAEDKTSPLVYGYWAELGEPGKARELGALGAAGDLFADGALGSHTAYLSQPYADHGDRGHGYLTRAQVAEHVIACARVGVQAGFHAIGDAALDNVLDGFAAAAEVVGTAVIRAGRHRIEHAEMLTVRQIDLLARLAIVVSAQPAFDAAWGGDGMYVQRLGRERAATMNPFRALADAGVSMAFGSDAPVTAIDPWAGVRAAARHQTAVHSLSAWEALTAHTSGGWRAIGQDIAEEGLRPGTPAHFAVWDLGDTHLTAESAEPTFPPLLESIVDGTVPRCVRTVVSGRTIFER